MSRLCSREILSAQLGKGYVDLSYNYILKYCPQFKEAALASTTANRIYRVTKFLAHFPRLRQIRRKSFAITPNAILIRL